MSFVWATIGGLSALIGVSAVSFTRHLASSSFRDEPSSNPPNDFPALSPSCLERLSETAVNCGCDMPDAASSKTSDVYLVFFLTYTVPKSRLLPSLSWTTHWAIKVDDVYFDLRRVPRAESNGEKRFFLSSETVADRERRAKNDERNVAMFSRLMGKTHLSHEQIKQIGESYAEGYHWDPLIRNCQTFLHEAYFGKPLLKPFRRKQEIRCSEHGSLRAMPAFTMITLSTAFAFTYLIEQGIEWYFHLVLSPGTLIMRCIPVVLGLSYFVPAIIEYLTSRGSLQQRLADAIANVPRNVLIRFRRGKLLRAVPSQLSSIRASSDEESLPLLGSASDYVP